MAKKNSKNKQIKSKKTNKSNKKEVKPAVKFFKKTNKKIIMFASMIIIFAAIAAFIFILSNNSTPDLGDKVKITSKVYLEDGTLISNSTTTYSFYIGDNTFADEIDSAVKTMRVGSTKKVFVDVNTTKIYPMKIISIPQKVVFNATYEIDKSLMPEAKIGDIFIAPGTSWNSTVINITQDKIIAKHLPKDMEHITYNYLDAVIPAMAINSKDGQRFSVVFNLAGGDKINIFYNEYVVKSATNIAITIHLNKLLSGEKLVQEITLVDIAKKNN